MHWGAYSQWGIVESWSICPEEYGWCERRKGSNPGNYIEYVKEYEGLKKTFNPTQFDPEKWASAADESEKEAIVREVLKTETFMDRAFRIRTADMQHTVDEFTKMNSGERESPFRGRLDLSRLGVFGHSGGGAVAGQCCVSDPRFKVGVNMDGFQFGDVIDNEVQQAFMFMYSEQFADSNSVMMNSFKNEVYALTVKGSTHMDFSDNPVVLPITKRMGMSGKIKSKRMTHILNSYLLSFFDKHLKGKDAQLLDGPSSDFPEVNFEKAR